MSSESADLEAELERLIGLLENVAPETAELQRSHERLGEVFEALRAAGNPQGPEDQQSFERIQELQAVLADLLVRQRELTGEELERTRTARTSVEGLRGPDASGGSCDIAG